MRALASTTDDVGRLAMLHGAAGRIEQRFVKPWSIAIFVLGIVQAYLGGLPMLGILQGASQNWLLISNLLFVIGFALVPLVFLPHGKTFGPLLDAALKKGRVTEPLKAELHNRTVRIAHFYEEVSLLVIVALMVLKPF